MQQPNNTTYQADSDSEQLLFFLFPVYQPAKNFIALIDAIILQKKAHHKILVVDDGSTIGQELFTQIEGLGITVLHHNLNRGKGAAIKTGLAWIIKKYPSVIGVVTADSDGQHLSNDIIRTADSIEESPQNFVLGVRHFDDSTPWRNKSGNKISQILFRKITGIDLLDTQTGLRGIPNQFIASLLDIDFDGYEFEMQMLFQAYTMNIHFQQIRIETVYLDNNASSHYRPFHDSVRIYKIVFKFIFARMFGRSR